MVYGECRISEAKIDDRCLPKTHFRFIFCFQFEWDNEPIVKYIYDSFPLRTLPKRFGFKCFAPLRRSVVLRKPVGVQALVNLEIGFQNILL